MKESQAAFDRDRLPSAASDVDAFSILHPLSSVLQASTLRTCFSDLNVRRRTAIQSHWWRQV